MARRRSPSSVAAQTTTQLDGGQVVADGAVRVLGLTILYHTDLERVGERAFLPENGPFELSRNQPVFSPPGVPDTRSLEASRVSRRPVWCRPGTHAGALVLDPTATRSALDIDGQHIAAPVEIPAEVIERGVVLTLGDQVVLLLHRLDPLAQPNVPRFGLVGECPALVRACRHIVQVADLDVPVLVRGETGTGKELVAQAIHRASPRRAGPYVPVNMAAIPGSLAATELFGAVKGAFTGAHRARTGYFRSADGGTLFLDEIGEMPVELQVMLLRALETREIRPVGADRSRPVDVRLVSATDANLETAVASQRFRAPLLHRLSGFVIQLPPLRERRADFGRLFVHFLRAEAEALGQRDRLTSGDQPWVPAALVARLARWHWPGNVRQLRNVVRQLVIAHRGMDRVTMLPAVASMLETGDAPVTFERVSTTPAAPARQQPVPSTSVRQPREISEDEMIEVLRAQAWRVQAAAEVLGISRPALYALIRKSDRVRTAADLSPAEVAAAHERHQGDSRAMAHELEVSERALRRRLSKLTLPPTGG